MTRGDRRQWFVILSGAFLVALAVALLVLWLYKPSQSLQQPQEEVGVLTSLPAGLAEAPVARDAYPAAVEVARSWQSDAGVAIAAAHWQPRQGRWPSDVTWMFQFYSPASRRMAAVVVEGGRARLLREARSLHPLPVFDEADWRIDSRAALDAWWRSGGVTLMPANSEVDVTAQLRVQQGEDGRLAWTITGIIGDRVESLIVDATTGEQLEDQGLNRE
jgi:hypothetical protein